MVILEKSDFGMIAVCAIRYCMGRKSYMPVLIRNIIRPRINELSNNDLEILINDCEFQEKTENYGDPEIDKPAWIVWRMELEQERSNRRDRQADLRDSNPEGK